HRLCLRFRRRPFRSGCGRHLRAALEDRRRLPRRGRRTERPRRRPPTLPPRRAPPTKERLPAGSVNPRSGRELAEDFGSDYNRGVTGLLALALVLGSDLLVPEGQPAPQLEGRTLDGRAWSDRITGELTIVEFFATWCPKCRHSLADQHRLAATRPVRLIIVDVDEDPLLVQAFFTRNPPPANAGLLIDQSGSARANWGVTGFPAVFVIDKAGIVRETLSGWGDRSAKYLAQRIDWLQGAEQ